MGVQLVAVESSEPEGVADLDAGHQLQRLVALNAAVAGAHLGDIAPQVGLEVARIVDVREVVAGLVGAGDQVGCRLDRVVHHHGQVGQADGRGVAGDQAGGLKLLVGGQPQVRRLQQAPQLGFVDLQVAADGHKGQGVAGPVENGFQGLVGFHAQIGGHVVDGFLAGGGDLFHGARLTVVEDRLPGLGDLTVGGVAAGGADDQGVFAGFGQAVELVGARSLHGAGVRFDDGRLDAAAAEGAQVGGHEVLVGRFLAFQVDVEAVGVLHGELTDAQQTTTGTRFVAELGLEVVDAQRQLAVGRHDPLAEVGGDLLVGHGQHHVAPPAVLEPRHLRADRGESAGSLPQIGGVDDGHQQFLAADAVHLLAHDLLDAALHPPAQRQHAVDARAQRPDVASPQEEAVGNDRRLGGIVAKRAGEQPRHALHEGRAREGGVRGRSV